MTHDPIRPGATERMIIQPATLVTADATQDLRVTQAEFDATVADNADYMRRRFGERGVSAARLIGEAFANAMVRR